MRRVLYRSTALDESLDVATKLDNEHDWRFLYWLAPALEDRVSEQFPEATFEYTRDADRAGIPRNHDERYDPLDERILDSYRPYRSDILRLMDRVDPGHAFSYDERVRHYHKLLRHWLDVFDDLDLDTVLFGSRPHTISDVVVYAICLERDLDLAIVTSPSLPDVLYLERRLDEPIAGLDPDDRPGEGDAGSGSISERTRTHIEGLFDKEDNVWTDQTRRFSYTEKLKQLADYPRFLAKLRERKWRHIKPRNKTIENADITLARKLFYRERERRHKRGLRKKYEALAVDPAFDDPYIYLPLHYETELSTVPLGGTFKNQLLAVDLLAKLVPDGWKVYVKEHPAQFYRSKVNRGREPYLYHDCLARENVRLVTQSASTYDLIDHAEAVATVTGTAGWEALIRGTPAIVFGYAWYRSCDEVYHTTERDDLAEAIRSIQAGEGVDRANVMAFVEAIETVGFRGYKSPGEREVTQLSPEENVGNIVDAVVEFLGD